MAFWFGIGLLIAGLVIFLLVWIMLRVVSRPQGATPVDSASMAFPEKPESNQAVIILQPGGRVEYISVLARSYFNLRENEPYDLERLARHVRPTSEFLDLCAAPGYEQISIDGKLMDVASYDVPGIYPMVLVAFRVRDQSLAVGQSNGASEGILQVVMEFSQGLVANLDLDTTIQSVLGNVARWVPSDLIELKLWNTELQTLVLHRPKLSPTNSSRPSNVLSTSRFGSLTNQLIVKHAPILLADARSQPELALNGELLPIQSYLGIPLMAGGELVGSLEAGQEGGGAFGQHDLELLSLVASQVAVAIRNAKLYEEEKKLGAELIGLANLNQALGSVRNTQDIFVRLVESMAPLFSAEVIGFLLYDEAKHLIEAKIPFRGLPSHFVEIYRTHVPVNSPAEKIIAGQQPVITLDAANDENWRALGLADIATAASLRDIALIPLLSSGHMLGYLQVGHHSSGVSSFSVEEIRLMHIVANQSAAIIENILLVHESRIRAQRADALRRIASLSGSSATLDEILKYSVQELANLFQADTGAVFLMDESRGELHLRRESTVGVSDDISTTFIQIFVDDPNYAYTVSGSQKPFLSGHLSTDKRILPAYRPLTDALRLESAMAVPLVVRGHSIGELMLGSFKTDYFNFYDLQITSTAGGNLATAVESASLLAQTDDSLRRRVDQLSSITRVSRELGASLDLKQLIHIIHEEGLRIVQADCSSIILFEQNCTLNDLRVELSVGCEAGREINSLALTALKQSDPYVVSDFVAENTAPTHFESVFMWPELRWEFYTRSLCYANGIWHIKPCYSLTICYKWSYWFN